MRSVAVLGACAVLTLTACASSSSSGPSTGGDLTGVTWVLDAPSMTTLSHGAPADARVDLVFDGSQASGRAACNSYFGGYQADAGDGTLSFANLGATMMACDQALMDVESAYLAALGDVTDYQVSGERRGLVLTGGDVALTFRAEQPAAPLPLENTTWTLTTVAAPGSSAVSSTVAGTEVTMTLDGGTANGSGGCNTYHASYDTADAALSFGPVASTKKMCEQSVADQEHAFFTGLEATASYTVEGEQLSLLDADGQLLLGFTGKA
jgi:heat shock protein HslJ